MKFSAPKSQIFERDGCPIHYWLVGSLSCPTVVFIHGAGADHHLFDPQVVAVASYFRILLWDLRGHGLSIPKGRSFSVSVVVEDLLALLDHIGVSQVAVVGISIGGNIAQEFVYRFPERVMALVTVGSGNTNLRIDFLDKLKLEIFMFHLRHGPLRILQAFFSCFASIRLEHCLFVYKKWRQLSKRDFLEIYEEFYLLYNRNLGKRHSKHEFIISQPQLLVYGRYDGTAHYKWQLTSWIKRDLCCIILPRAGHLANRDNYRDFNRILIEFLRSHLYL